MLMAEISMERKLKSQKAKTKTSDGRKQLSSVRVLQRNLVYVVGLPLNLADEDLLIRKEYFAQYGKVLKVSISRTSAGTIQQFANNSCSVYITYSKEEEAVRCILLVHGFNLEGRSLRTCFGTTKYCHAWLRSVPCTNPDCLYLHEVGSTEDSFTKDEIISAYSRVQQITGISNNVQRRSGTVLPPPADDYCPNSSATTGKPVVKCTTNIFMNNARVSPSASSAGRTGVLPPAASWGTRASTCQSLAGSTVHSNGPTKQKLDVAGGPPLAPSTVATTATTIQSSDIGRKVKLNDDTLPTESRSKLELPEYMKQHGFLNPRNGVLENSYTPSGEPIGMVSIGRIPSPSRALNTSKIKDLVDEQSDISAAKERVLGVDAKNRKIDKNCFESINNDKQPSSENSAARSPDGLCLDYFLFTGNQASQQHCDTEKLPEHSSCESSKDVTSIDVSGVSNLVSPWRSDIQASAMQSLSSETEDDFGSQQPSNAILVNQENPSSPSNLLNNLQIPSPLHSDAASVVNHNGNPPIVHKQTDDYLLTSASNLPTGFLDNVDGPSSGIGSSCLLQNEGKGNQSRKFVDIELNPSVDVIENSIISNILSLDLDAWDDSLTSPQNLVKLLGQTEREQGSLNMSDSWKAQNNNQSRFSFARQDCRSQTFDDVPSFSSEAVKTHSFGPTFVESRDSCLDRLKNGFGISHRNSEAYGSLASNQSVFSNNKLNAARAQISAPPGFSAPSRLPPPGFSSHDINSGNHFIETSSLLRNPYQASPSANISTSADIEFMDPAILAVGKGRLPSGLNNLSLDVRPNFASQSLGFENDSGLQLLMQTSLSAHQSQRFGDLRDNYSPNDGYGFTSRSIGSSQASNMSSFLQFSPQQPRNGVISNGHYDAWPDVHVGNDIGIAELLRNDRLCFNKLYGGYEDSKFQMPSSGDLYNRTFGM